MSTATQVNPADLGGFSEAEVAVLPRLVCVGTIGEVSEAKDTRDGEGLYKNIRITLDGERGSKKVTFNFLFREDWFTPGFDAASLKNFTTEDNPKAGENLYNMYAKTITRKVKEPIEKRSKVTLLEGLCGSTENFLRFVEMRNEAYIDQVKNDPERGMGYHFTKEEIRELLHRFLMIENAGMTIGYELAQRREKTGEVNDAGKAIYAATDFYDMDSLYVYLGEDSDKRALKRVANGKGKVRVAYEID